MTVMSLFITEKSIKDHMGLVVATLHLYENNYEIWFRNYVLSLL